MSDDDGEVLKRICDEAINDPSLKPKTIKGVLVTHCSEGATKIAEELGCYELKGYDADEQYQIMDSNHSGRWEKVSGSDATIHALGGGLAFAALPSHRLESDHGHITAIYPVGMQASGSLGKDVPMVANVGKQNGEEKTSQAFPVHLGEPDYFTWK